MKRFFRTVILVAGMVAIFGIAAIAAANTVPASVTSYARFEEAQLSGVRPEGWLRQFLVNQKQGLTGHIRVAGDPFDQQVWYGDEYSNPDIESGWVSHEQTAYWVDGALKCGRFLGDKLLTDMALRRINYVLDHPSSSGCLGPACLTPNNELNRWPHIVFFRALMAEYSFTGDHRILDALTRHYLNDHDHYALRRDVCNVEAMLWLYNQTGDKRLLQRAVKAYNDWNQQAGDDDTTLVNMTSDRVMTSHGVNFNEQAKLPAILYVYTGDRKYLDPAVNAYQKVDRDHMLIDGIPSSAEALGGRLPIDRHETCNITDYTWSIGYLLMATGKAEYADRIERACLNAAPSAVASDFKALQYFSAPNQVVFRADQATAYRPSPGTQCCTGNVNRMMPNYVARMWMRDKQHGFVAALYGPSVIKAEVASGKTVTIREETQYPFRDTITFNIKCIKPVDFPLSLRIPAWADGATIQLNGKPLPSHPKPGTFATINRKFLDGDRIVLTLPMKLKLVQWPTGGVAIERGPLVYALKIQEKWERNVLDGRSSSDLPAWKLSPASDWNYALAVDSHNLEKQIQVIQKPVPANPWSLESAPIELRVPARKVNGWTCEDRTLDDFGGSATEKSLYTPMLPEPSKLGSMLSDDVETVTLVPYGCARVRITVFPQAGVR